jgi:hypothetical protein
MALLLITITAINSPAAGPAPAGPIEFGYKEDQNALFLHLITRAIQAG